ncbi:MAG: HAD family hydrolase [Cyanobacterium sp. T60_A2020_053]|nr:HAD family hydrolase [Cyanobacterium sp. T60_A2020_053]
MSLSALIFDVDGTLAETERDGHRVAFNHAFKSLGLPWCWSVELYGNLLAIGGGKERLKYYLTNFHPDFTFDDDFIVKVYQLKNKYFQQLITENKISLRPGVIRLITEAKESNIKMAIASTSGIDNVEALINHIFPAHLQDCFAVIVAGDMVAQKKPAPSIYLLALQKLQLPPQECLAIEDTAVGLRAAKGAGLTTVITVNDYTLHDDFTGADLILNNLGEPSLPFSVIAGDSYGETFFNLNLAKSLNEL